MNLTAHASTPETSLPSRTSAAPATPKAVWAGRVLSALVVLFLAFDAVCKIARLPVVVEASAKLGFGEGAIFGIGLVLLACTILYVIPRTAVLGAVLLTGYLGGAVCTHVRSFDGVFPIVFSSLFGVLVWVGLGLRDERVRAMVAPPAKR